MSTTTKAPETPTNCLERNEGLLLSTVKDSTARTWTFYFYAEVQYGPLGRIEKLHRTLFILI